MLESPHCDGVGRGVSHIIKIILEKRGECRARGRIKSIVSVLDQALIVDREIIIHVEGCSSMCVEEAARLGGPLLWVTAGASPSTGLIANTYYPNPGTKGHSRLLINKPGHLDCQFSTRQHVGRMM